MPLPLVLLCGGLPRLLAQPQVALPLLQLATAQGTTGADATLGQLMLELLELCFLGLAPGERVAAFMTNCPEYLEVLYGIWWAGLVAVPVP